MPPTVKNRRREVSITIQDSGPGIPIDNMPHIFEPFYTTKEIGQGMGMGLAIAYGIIEEHQGEITAFNSPIGGAVFEIKLPISQNPKPIQKSRPLVDA